MSRDSSVNVFRPSLLDRLRDAHEVRYGQTLQQLEEAIRRDLQDLLNTHRPPREQFDNLEYAGRSVANYGLGDFTQVDVRAAKRFHALLEHIKEVIEAYEPRLTDVQVLERANDEVEKIAKRDYQMNALYFQIKARINGDPAPEVSFETILELAKGAHIVKKELA